MQRFGQNAQAAGAHREKYLQRDEQHGRAYGGQRRHSLFAGCALEEVGRHRGIIRCGAALDAHRSVSALEIETTRIVDTKQHGM